MKYHLIIHPELKQDMDRLYQAYKQDQNSPQAGTAPKPSSAPAANVTRPSAPTRSQDRNRDS